MDQHALNPDKIDLIIVCFQCKSPLWQMQILSRFGDKVGSSAYRPLGDTIPEFSDKILDCPLCRRHFYNENEKGEHSYLAVDPESGRSLVI